MIKPTIIKSTKIGTKNKVFEVKSFIHMSGAIFHEIYKKIENEYILINEKEPFFRPSIEVRNIRQSFIEKMEDSTKTNAVEIQDMLANYIARNPTDNIF